VYMYLRTYDCIATSEAREAFVSEAPQGFEGPCTCAEAEISGNHFVEVFLEFGRLLSFRNDADRPVRSLSSLEVIVTVRH